MKPARFDYAAPGNLSETLSLLDREQDATVLAGGQSLLPLLNLRLATPRLVVDINRLDELDRVDAQQGSLKVGALTRLRAIEFSAVAKQHCRLLAETAALIASAAVRSRGTVGGSVAHADPRAELPTALVALDAVFCLRTAGGDRRVPARDFFRGAMLTALAPGELLCSVEIPALPDGARTAFLERRVTHGAFAQAGVAVVLSSGVHAAIAVLGAGPVPIRARAAERAWLDGADPSEVAGLAGALASDEHRAAQLCALTSRALEVAR
jgi:aerobic carbon-monoxide dehydrogenase medium subunit